MKQRRVGIGQLVEIRVDEEIVHIDLKMILVLLDVITKESSMRQFIDLLLFEKSSLDERGNLQRGFERPLDLR